MARRRMSSRKPFAQNCAIIVPSHRRPTVTCVQAVQADQREEGRKEGAAAGTRAFRQHMREFVQFERQEAEAQNAGDKIATRVHSMLRTLVAIAAMPQTKLDSSRSAVSHPTVVRLKSCCRPRPSGGRLREHGIGRIEPRKHDEVGEEEDPEAVSGDDALRRWPREAAVRLDARAHLVRVALMVRRRPRVFDGCDALLTPLDQRDAGPAPFAIDPRESSACSSYSEWSRQASDKGRKGADKSDDDHPPDLPDQREFGDGREKGHHDTRGAVPRQFDRPVFGQIGQPAVRDRQLLDAR